MFEHRTVEKRKRQHLPAVPESIAPGTPAWAPSPAQSTETVSPQRPSAGFDIGSIAILPPAPQVGAEGGDLSPDLTNRIRNKQGSGSSLEHTVQEKMEDSLGDDFSAVRIHEGGEADTLNRSVGAKAFTLGSDIFLSQAATSAGRYGGDALLAHELTHVAQQRDAGQSERLTVGPAGNGYEREADAVAGAIPQGDMSGKTVGTVPETVVQRAPDPMVPDAISGADRATLKPGSLAAMEREIAVLRKKQQADELDAEWRAKFGKKLASYEQAMWRVTGGIEAANQGFQTAQAAQARANQMWAQLFGLGLSVVFAGGFEWVAMKGLGPLGSKLKTAPKDIVEKIENPANALVGGLLTNVRTTSIANRDAVQGGAPANRDAVQGAAPAVTGGGAGAMAYLAEQADALKGHTVAIEGAFDTRAQKMKSLTEDEVLAFDLEVQAKDYNKMFNDLAGSGSDADLLEPPEMVGRIIERHLWATWIKGEHMTEIAEMMDSPAQKRFGTQTGEQMEAQNHDALSDFGKEINQRLIDLSVEALSGALLQTHWWQRNGDDWESKLMNWARDYKESIAK